MASATRSGIGRALAEDVGVVRKEKRQVVFGPYDQRLFGVAVGAQFGCGGSWQPQETVLRGSFSLGVQRGYRAWIPSVRVMASQAGHLAGAIGWGGLRVEGQGGLQARLAGGDIDGMRVRLDDFLFGGATGPMATAAFFGGIRGG